MTGELKKKISYYFNLAFACKNLIFCILHILSLFQGEVVLAPLSVQALISKIIFYIFYKRETLAIKIYAFVF